MSQHTTDEPLAYDVEEAARKLGMGRTWTWNAVRDGTLPSIRIGKRVLVTRTALEDFVRDLESKQSA